jgi:hypothetical protein
MKPAVKGTQAGLTGVEASSGFEPEYTDLQSAA